VKLVPIGFSLLTFVVLLLILSKTGEPASVHVFGAISAFGFPTYFLSSYYGLGNHMEIAFFIAIGLGACAALLILPLRKSALPFFLILGFAAGFGLFYNLLILSFFVTLIPIALIIAYRFARNHTALFIKGAALAILGFAVGFSPYFSIHKSIKAPMGIDAFALRSIPE